jgi:hypothetical protein
MIACHISQFPIVARQLQGSSEIPGLVMKVSSPAQNRESSNSSNMASIVEPERPLPAM